MPIKKDSIPKDTQKKKGRVENLIPLNQRAKDAQREIQSKGGKVCAEKKREQILMSRIFSDFLVEEHEVILRDDQGEIIDREKISAKELIKRTITGVLSREDSASVAMMKTITESTEGQKMQLSGLLETASLTSDERKKRIAELEKKRSGK